MAYNVIIIENVICRRFQPSQDGGWILHVHAICPLPPTLLLHPKVPCPWALDTYSTVIVVFRTDLHECELFIPDFNSSTTVPPLFMNKLREFPCWPGDVRTSSKTEKNRSVSLPCMSGRVRDERTVKVHTERMYHSYMNAVSATCPGSAGDRTPPESTTT